MLMRNGQGFYYGVDQIGSVRDVLNAATGGRIAHYDFDPFGQITGAIPANTDFSYAGLVYDSQTSLYLAPYRSYSPEAGKWTSRDPIGEAGGLNIYGYVDGNPLTFFDWLGLCAPKINPADPAACAKGNQLACDRIVDSLPGGDPMARALEATGVAAASGAVVAAGVAAVEGLGATESTDAVARVLNMLSGDPEELPEIIDMSDQPPSITSPTKPPSPPMLPPGFK